MRKTTFIILFLFIGQLTAFAQYTAIPDSNFEQALINFGVDSEGTLDGQILTADAESETSLTVVNQNITDLTGIDAFINLTAINVSYNAGITSLDLSNNTLLVDINTEECSSLATLNLSGLTNLQVLNLFNNDLSTLDVSGNAGLTIINVRYNNLSILDLSDAAAIISVEARNNALTVIDMRNGNNANVPTFRAEFNPGPCIMVDDISEPNLANWQLDGASSFYENDIDCPTLSVGQEDAKTFNMYPNPVKNTLYVMSSVASAELEVYSITGKLVIKKRIGFGQNSVNVTALKSGVYLAKFASTKGTYTKKLIIN